MNFWKKLFAGMGFVCGFLVFETMSLAYHNSRRRHKNRKGRCRRNSFWDTLTRYMIFAWIYDGVKKSREQVGRRYYRRTGNEFRPSYDSGTRSNPSEPAKAAPKTADAAQSKKQRPSPSAPKTTAKSASAPTADRLKVPAAEAKPPRETTGNLPLRRKSLCWIPKTYLPQSQKRRRRWKRSISRCLHGCAPSCRSRSAPFMQT